MRHRNQSLNLQRGVVLVSSLLLLMVVTIMAISMMRSFGIQEKIGGNVRDKQRALQAANSTQSYAEWWLVNQSFAPKAISIGATASADVPTCTTLIDANLVSGLNGGQICMNTLQAATGVSATAWPAISSGSTNDVGAAYTPPCMNVNNNYAGAVTTCGPSGTPDLYFKRPRFYIQDMGSLATARGEVYKVDAYSYGLSESTVAVVESTVTITCLVCNLGAT